MVELLKKYPMLHPIHYVEVKQFVQFEIVDEQLMQVPVVVVER